MDNGRIKRHAAEWFVEFKDSVDVKQEPPSCSLSDERCSSAEACVDVGESELAEVLDEHDRLEADLAYQCCLAENRFGQAYEGCDELPDPHSTNLTLWQFLLELLINGKRPDIIHWTNTDGEFQLLKAEEVAQLWGMRKNKNHRMNYDKLSRALRYYYQKNIIRKVHGQKFVYKFIGLNQLALDACRSALEQRPPGSDSLSIGSDVTLNAHNAASTNRFVVAGGTISSEANSILPTSNGTHVIASLGEVDKTLASTAPLVSVRNVTSECKKTSMAGSVEATSLCNCNCHSTSATTVKMCRPNSVSTPPPIKKRAVSPGLEPMASGSARHADWSSASTMSTTPWPLDLSCSAPPLYVGIDSYSHQQHLQTQHSRHSANMSRLAEQLHLQKHNAITAASLASTVGYMPSSTYFAHGPSSSVANSSVGQVDTKMMDFDTSSYHAALAASDSAVCVWMPIPIHLINRVWKTFLDPAALDSSPTVTSPFSTTN